MTLRQDYARAVGVTPATYSSDQSAVDRLSSIYGTARKGRLGRSISRDLWDTFFSALVAELPALPGESDGFDDLAIKRIGTLAQRLREQGRGDFGVAQKMVNLVVKGHWALEAVPTDCERLIHIPLDATVLRKLERRPDGWASWTKASVDRAPLDVLVSGYLNIQRSYRAYWASLSPRFDSPIEMEQMLWQSVPLVEA